MLASRNKSITSCFDLSLRDRLWMNVRFLKAFYIKKEVSVLKTTKR